MTVVENNVNTGNAATAADVADERPVVLKVDHVAKSFRLPTEQASGLKMAFLNWTKGIKAIPNRRCSAISASKCIRATSSASSDVMVPENPPC